MFTSSDHPARLQRTALRHAGDCLGTPARLAQPDGDFPRHRLSQRSNAEEQIGGQRFASADGPRPPHPPRPPRSARRLSCARPPAVAAGGMLRRCRPLMRTSSRIGTGRPSTAQHLRGKLPESGLPSADARSSPLPPRRGRLERALLGVRGPLHRGPAARSAAALRPHDIGFPVTTNLAASSRSLRRSGLMAASSP